VDTGVLAAPQIDFVAYGYSYFEDHRDQHLCLKDLYGDPIYFLSFLYKLAVKI